MAGLGFKTFVADDILGASELNGYLMQQTVMVFATTTARDTAITAPTNGMLAYITAADATKGLYLYNGTAWGFFNVAPSAAKFWVSFTTVTTTAILGSYNVSSLTDNDVGRTTINLTTAFSSANYSVAAISKDAGNSTITSTQLASAPTAGAMTVLSVTSTPFTLVDSAYVSVVGFGAQ